MKKKIIMLTALTIIALTLMPLSLAMVPYEKLMPESSEIQQVLPEEGKYWNMHVFTEDESLKITGDGININSIQCKMDYWHYRGEDAPDFHELQDSFYMINSTGAQFCNIYSSNWGSWVTNNESSYYGNCIVNAKTSSASTTVKGGYFLESYNDYYYRVNSNTSLFSALGVLGNQFNFDTFIDQEFNLSTNLLLSKNNLTAQLLNNSEILPIDNFLFYNIDELNGLAIGGNMSLNGLNFTMVEINDDYFLLESIRDTVTRGLKNKTMSIYIKKTGEIWGFQLNRHYSGIPYTMTYGDSNVYHNTTEDVIQFWFGMPHYVPGDYLKPNNDPQWKSILYNLLFILIPVSCITGLVLLIRKIYKKRKDKGEKKSK